ncbi:phosphoribosyltransferase [Actinomadura sp. SCN-SB]|uniref:phosphoribosyltransferase n=1 Tax=Actinomadura sp. SCN-SB TaxID=3373092 RepID=UPI0037531A24
MFDWLVPSLIAIAGIAIGLQQYAARGRQQLLIDLQGENAAAAAAVAMKVQAGQFPKGRNRRSTRRRRQLFEALCLATVFTRSGRSRSLIYTALVHAGRTDAHRRADSYRQEIKEIVDQTSVTVSRNWAYTDLSRARRRLYMLRAALGLDGDLRIRLDESELVTRVRSPSGKPDAQPAERPPGSYPELGDNRFSWDALEEVVRQLGSLVIVGPQDDATGAIIALDYHRYARPISETQRREELQLTDIGAQVVLAKYGPQRSRSAVEPTAAHESLADRLATVVELHPEYQKADAMAAVPGSYSVRLANAVANRTNKSLVKMIEIQADRPGDPPQLTVEEPSTAEGKRIILIDDVYRSGAKLRAASTALRNARARQILGLTATCTISASEPPCAHKAPRTTKST